MRSSHVTLLLLALIASVDVSAQDVAWTTTFDAPNASGVVVSGALSPAPGGDVCAATAETLPGNAYGLVVTRYAADGSVRWAHPVEAWQAYVPGKTEAIALGDACAVVVILSDATGAGGAAVARVEEAGVAWATEVVTPSTETSPDRVSLAVSGDGVWAGIGEVRAASAALVRLDATGREVARATFEPSTVIGRPLGVRALASLPDGRALALVNGESFAVVETDGAAALTPFADGFQPTALVADPGPAPAALVLGSTAADQAAVRRLALDGSATWTTTLSADLDRRVAAFIPPYTLALSGDDLYATWRSTGGPRVARLARADGTIIWDEAVGTDENARPRAIAIDAAGPVVWTTYVEGSLSARSADRGRERWTVVTAGALEQGRPLVSCAGGGSCFAGEGAVEARSAAGAVAWEAIREGAPYADYRVEGLAALSDGVVLAGYVADADGEAGLWLGRLNAGGDVIWEASPQGLAGVPSGLRGPALLDDGAVVVASSFIGGGSRSAVIVVGPDGSERWTRETEGVVRGVGALSDGGLAVVVDVSDASGLATPRVIRYGADGTERGATDLPDPGALFSLGVYPTPDGLAVAQFVFGNPSQIRVDRLGTDGSYGGRTATTGVGGCQIVPSADIAAGIDAVGTVHVVAEQSNGPVSCARPTVLRFDASGAVAGTPLNNPFEGAGLGIDVQPGGGASVLYGNRVARFDASGSLRADIAYPDVALSGVAAGRGDQSFAAGTQVLAGTPGQSPVYVGSGAGTVQGTLPELVGLPTETGPVALFGFSRTGYVALRATVGPVSVAAVSQITGAVPVADERGPSPEGSLIVSLGPNPVLAGAPVRVRLSETASLALYDMLGRRIASWPETADEIAFPAPEAAGIYVLRAATEVVSETSRVVVVH